jgi:hypothetical protein
MLERMTVKKTPVSVMNNIHEFVSKPNREKCTCSG